jgi:hypothetical protein
VTIHNLGGRAAVPVQRTTGLQRAHRLVSGLGCVGHQPDHGLAGGALRQRGLEVGRRHPSGDSAALDQGITNCIAESGLCDHAP